MDPHSKGRYFKLFVLNRAEEIQNNVYPCQWKHIPSEHNVANDVFRGIKAFDLSRGREDKNFYADVKRNGQKKI